MLEDQQIIDELQENLSGDSLHAGFSSMSLLSLV